MPDATAVRSVDTKTLSSIARSSAETRRARAFISIQIGASPSEKIQKPSFSSSFPEMTPRALLVRLRRKSRPEGRVPPRES